MIEIADTKDLEQMLSNMDGQRAEVVHFLFMENYINWSNYRFRDDGFVYSYCDCYNEAFKTGFLHSLDYYLMHAMDEWKQDAPKIFNKAKKDLELWMQYDIPSLEPSMSKEISEAYEIAITLNNADAIWRSFLPFPIRIAKQIKSKDYVGAASNLYCIIEQLAKAYTEHEDWFEEIPDSPNTWLIPDIVNFRDLTFSMYSHLRQKSDLPKKLKSDMDIHFHIFNLKTEFLGDIDCDSSISDMFHDKKDQFGNYSVLEKHYTWQWYMDKLKES